jgi:hypothetical protein
VYNATTDSTYIKVEFSEGTPYFATELGDGTALNIYPLSDTVLFEYSTPEDLNAHMELSADTQTVYLSQTISDAGGFEELEFDFYVDASGNGIVEGWHYIYMPERGVEMEERFKATVNAFTVGTDTVTGTLSPEDMIPDSFKPTVA